MERRVVGVAKTARGGAMRSSSQRISSLDSSSSGTQSMTRSALRTASSMEIGKPRRRRREDRARRGHAVEQPENFQLGFQLIRHAVDDQIGVAYRLLDGGDEDDVGESFGTEYGAKGFLGVVQIGGHHVQEALRAVLG